MHRTQDEIYDILESHRLWLEGNTLGKRADFTRVLFNVNANLRGIEAPSAIFRYADLEGLDLQNADLSKADLSYACLNGANLKGADLSEANLFGASLNRANLYGADLSNAVLKDTGLLQTVLEKANLDDSCLDDNLRQLQRRFCKECPPNRYGGRIVVRSQQSLFVQYHKYEVGKTYVAPFLSASIETECHPGIYAASWKWIKHYYPTIALVACYVRDGDWFISSKGAIRCKRLRVISEVNSEKEFKEIQRKYGCVK